MSAAIVGAVTLSLIATFVALCLVTEIAIYHNGKDDVRMSSNPPPKSDAMTEAEAAQRAAGETWRWWGPIERSWAPDLVTDSLGRPEKNLQWWFRGFWRLHPRSRPKDLAE